MTMHRSAVISKDGMFRYRLSRQWRFGSCIERVLWIMLNPSTADAEVDDPTIRRIIRYSKDWGYGALDVVNLFALRCTNPKELKLPRIPPYECDVHGPIGCDNKKHVYKSLIDPRVTLVMGAWGNGGAYRQRGRWMRHFVGEQNRELYTLGHTNAGEPLHPLYQPSSATPKEWDE